jgi:PAS domain S-box-containing protein
MTDRLILIVGDDIGLRREIAARLVAMGYDAVPGDAAAGPGAPPGPFVRADLHSAGPGRSEPDAADLTPTVTPSLSDRELCATVELAFCRHDAARMTRELEAFFAVARDLFCFLDFNGHFRRLNPAWERTLGFTREELMSRPFIEFVHPDDRKRTLAQNAAVLAGGQAADFENRYLCKDGSYRWLVWNATSFTAEQVVYSVARDITARKEAEAERAGLVSRLEASLAEVRSLQDILPICMYCRKIRDDEDYWHTVEGYISTHTSTRFSHGICPDCEARLEMDDDFK